MYMSILLQMRTIVKGLVKKFFILTQKDFVIVKLLFLFIEKYGIISEKFQLSETFRSKLIFFQLGEIK